MLKKLCPYCRKESFSASDRSRWVCPYCRKDLTGVPASPAEEKRKGSRDTVDGKTLLRLRPDR